MYVLLIYLSLTGGPLQVYEISGSYPKAVCDSLLGQRVAAARAVYPSAQQIVGQCLPMFQP